MFTALPCTGVREEEKLRQAFYRKPPVNSMIAISAITCGGRFFRLANISTFQLTDIRAKTA
jgi:hypothetical protein